MMDRIDRWRLFVAVAEHASFAEAARRAGRSPQAVTRAIAALEAAVGARLLARTTRSVSLTDDGARYLERCRRVLADVDELDAAASVAGEPRGALSVTAPVLFGELHVAPIVSEYLSRHPAVDVRLALHDRVVSLAEEGIDVAVRIGDLPDSALRARRVGEVRRVLCASPAYLRRRGTPRTPRDLAGHDVIAFTGTTAIADRWGFATGAPIRVHPRLVVNTGRAAIDAALAGLGIVRVLSYQVAPLLARRRLVAVLAEHEPAALPVHLVTLPSPQVPVRVSVFLELAAARLRRVAQPSKPA
jgi:DNA-binding transcriptional LysR family regulator